MVERSGPPRPGVIAARGRRASSAGCSGILPAMPEFGLADVGALVAVGYPHRDIHRLALAPRAVREDEVHPSFVLIAWGKGVRRRPLRAMFPMGRTLPRRGQVDRRPRGYQVARGRLHHLNARHRIRPSRRVGNSQCDADDRASLGQRWATRRSRRKHLAVSEIRCGFVDLDSQLNTLAAHLPPEADRGEQKAENANDVRQETHAPIIAGEATGAAPKGGR